MNRKEMMDKIISLKTENGGWLKKDLESLGVSWPPQKGWMEDLLNGYDD